MHLSFTPICFCRREIVREIQSNNYRLMLLKITEQEVNIEKIEIVAKLASFFTTGLVQKSRASHLQQ